MKVPKTFMPEKDLEVHMKRLLSEKPSIKSYNEITVEMLLKKCLAFTEKQSSITNLLRVYETGEGLARELNFTKGDIEEASKRIGYYKKEDEYAGFYISALVNKVITEQDIINLKFDLELKGVGAYLKKGTLVVDGYVGFALGHCMEGGIIITKNGAGNDIGNGMLAGTIIVKGDAGTGTGIFSEGGDIFIYGDIEKISESCKAKVCKWGVQVWPR